MWTAAECAADTIMRNETNLASISGGVKSEAVEESEKKKPFRSVSRHRGGSLSLFHLKIDWERRK